MQTVDQNALMNCLMALPPIELRGIALLQNPAPDRTELREAVTELITYTNTCRRIATRLQDTPPKPLTTFTLAEWAL